MSTEISNRDDFIDSRDVIARIEELQDAEERDEDEQEELDALLALQEEVESYCSDWRHGEALIRDSYFRTYAEELANDIGAIGGNESWPFSCIDWKAAAEDLQEDYTAVDFDGVKYWVR